MRYSIIKFVNRKTFHLMSEDGLGTLCSKPRLITWSNVRIVTLIKDKYSSRVSCPSCRASVRWQNRIT